MKKEMTYDDKEHSQHAQYLKIWQSSMHNGLTTHCLQITRLYIL